jgi:transcriptional regulator with XRE-family HTH domain
MTGITLHHDLEVAPFYAHKVALRGRRSTESIYRLLKEYRDSELEGSTSSLAELLGLRYTVVSRWLEDKEERRTAPSPEACVLIAEKLQVDPIRVFKKAGYLPESTVTPARPHWDDDLRDLMRKAKRIIRRASSEDVWDMLKPVIARDVDSWARLLDEYESLIERRRRPNVDGPPH